ncbi:hypothetical protein TBLA_0G02070 [Henningerozyma blattae CBS 6284]|uniref:NAD(P)-binding protein n=1 Tax=Henningerozyma blattae (strain ATCC 34711 / CBS 6284 / DSM 70876 / NBRC 10599 / NRRL Y-10934 / UCD 77-7) TaxID=1071380 RepID=I2H6Z7_HENB6|nr:hypothetical protein TBLA_0G02070 [Tetrapisispora blattae CBS 6284]CCH62149.1 hypothetical protein TBLA_0G02070 [Tetrapisispora blattae CBS 6284]
MISIDILIPILSILLKFPILIILPFYKFSNENRITIIICLIYSIFINGFLIFNDWHKSKGSWLPVGELVSHKRQKYIIITGGSNGLGKQIIEDFLKTYSNIEIINLDIKPWDNSLKTDRVHHFTVDLSNIEELTAVIGNIKSKYLINGVNPIALINNAGTRTEYKTLFQSNIIDDEKIFTTNLKAPILLIQQLINTNLKEKTKDTGQCYIINIASSLGILSPSKVSTYAASKASLIAMSNSLSHELMQDTVLKDRIRCLLVIVGQLNTTMFNGFEPPRQFLAPVIDIKMLSTELIKCLEIGKRGELYLPFYSNFVYPLMFLPYSIQHFARWISQMDSCLPEEKAKAPK